MATYYIPTDITGGTILVNDGDVFIFESVASNNVKFESASGSPTNFAIEFNESNPNNIGVVIESNLTPTITVADGVALDGTFIDARNADATNVTIGDDVTLDKYQGSAGTDTVVIGDNFTTNNDFMTEDGNDHVTIGENATAPKFDAGGGNDTVATGDPDATITNTESILYPDGVVTGTSGDDVMGVGYSDAETDEIDGSDNTIIGLGGGDTISGGAGADVIYGDYAPSLTTPPEPAAGAEQLSFDITNGDVDGGSVDYDIRSFGDDALANDLTVVNTASTPITQLHVRGLGDGDGQTDVIRIDLSTFSDDFELELFNSRPEDVIYLLGMETATDNGDGTFTYTYVGSDDALHSVTVTPGDATVSGFYAEAQSGTHDDVIDGGAGDDTIYADGGDDIVTGGTGADVIYGGAGADDLDGGDDADTFVMEDGFGSDTITGGEGGTDDDVIDLSALSGPVTVTYTGDEAGTISDGTDTLNFSGIERLILTDQADVVDASADSAGIDVTAGGGDDSITGGAGADTITGGGGSDTITGGDGDDHLIGDGAGGPTQPSAGGERIGFLWSEEAASGALITSGSQTINGVTVDYVSTADSDRYDQPTPVDGIDAGDGSVDTNSALDVDNAGLVTMDFSEGVQNVQFRLSGINSLGGVEVRAYDEFGNLVPITSTTGANIVASDNDAAEGDETFAATTGEAGLTNSILVDIPSTITKLEVEFSGTDDIQLTDIWFDDPATVPEPAGNGGADIIDGGAGNDTIDGGEGDDTLTGGTGADTIEGGAGADSIDGGEGNDTIDGGSGSDYIEGGVGDDVLTGGTEDQTEFTRAAFRWSDVPDPDDGGQIDNNDILSTGTQTVEGIDVDFTFSSTFASFKTGAVLDSGLNEGDLALNPNSALSLDAGASNMTLTFDQDVSNVAFRISDFEDFTETVNIQAYDALGNPVEITSTIGSEITATDTDGVPGADQFVGNADSEGGDVDPNNSVLFEIAGPVARIEIQKTDSGGSLVTTDIFFDAPVQVASLDDNDTLIGGEGNDSIEGLEGDDSLLGGAGADTISGGDGNDYIDGGDGDDFLTTGIGNDTLIGGAGNDTLMNSAGDDSLVGGTGDDSIVATLGNDTLEGNDGNDTLIGGENNDSLVGGAGDDRLEGGTGDDFQDGGGDADLFVLEDAFGNDTIIGGETGTDDDTVDLSALTGAVTVNYTADEAGTITDGTDTITFSEIERLILTDQADDVDATVTTQGVNLDGQGGNDTIEGGSGDDTLDGGAGDDSVLGGDGDDFFERSGGNNTLDGGAGSDFFEIGLGNDTVIGGETGSDQDTLSIADANDAIDVTFTGDGAGTFVDSDGDTGQFSEIEAFELSDGADSVLGSADSAGFEVAAGAGDDTLVGGAGGDTLEGGADDDSLTGGDGDDVFVYNAGDGNDTISDFNTGNSGALGDGDETNNDFIDLGAFYDRIGEVRGDFADDGILNQSNDGVDGADYSDNSQFSGGSLTFQGATPTSFTADNTGVVCFTSGTMIRTPRGNVLIDDLREGDLVTTMDNGPQRIVWIGRRHLGRAELLENEKLRPILIKQGVLGVERDMLVSRQHGMLIGRDNLARAIHLAETTPGIRIAKGKRQVTYIHLMFEAHQIIFAEGVPSESFYPGPMGLKMMGGSAREELMTLFPELACCDSRDDVVRC